MSFGSSSSAVPSAPVTAPAQVLQAAASPAAQPAISPPPIPLPPPAAQSPVLGSSLTQVGGIASKEISTAIEGMGDNGTIKTSPQGVQAPANIAKVTLLGK